jgi:carbohydrate/starch-binding protein with CBM21 domain
MDAVRLKLARREFFSGGGFSGSFAPLAAKVKNLAFEKQVSVLYTPDGATWKEAPLAFSAHFGDYDLFEGTVNEQVTQFVIRYSVAGQTFFDNNAGQNYGFGSNLAVVGRNVILSKAVAKRGAQAGGGFVFTTSWLEGEILANNLAFVKDIGVRMSSDGGLTWADTSASFAGSHTTSGTFVGPGAEVWRFKTPELNLNESSPFFRFAVFYRDVATGAVFWDNNFAQDYKVSKSDGSTIL